MKTARLLLAAFFAFAPMAAFAQAPAAPAAPQQVQTQAQPGWDKTVPLTTTIVQAPPVAPPAVIDTGSIAGQALMWVITTFGGLAGAALTGLLYRLLQKAGVDLTQAQRDKLQDIVVNGLNLSAAKAAQDMQGRGQIEIKNAAVANAVTYAQTHAADTLKSLGLDPTSTAAVDAIKARIETAIADDNTPTAAVLDGPANAPAVAPAPVAAAAPAPKPSGALEVQEPLK